MNKVICDVCGTDYPETEPRCPLCDCVRSEGNQTAAGNTQEYTYVKGGRFSKSNVRKRLKSSQQSQETIPLTPPPVEDTKESKTPAVPENPKPSVKPENPKPPVKPTDPPEDEDDDFDEDELDSVSNRGLIIIVILLLVAIIAVSSYLAIVFFRSREEKDWAKTSSSTSSTNQQDPGPSDEEPGPSDEEPGPSDENPGDTKKPCTNLMVTDELILSTLGQNNLITNFVQAEPADTTDTYTFTSNDTNVVTVDQKGNVKAVGPGETTITVKCGAFEAEVVVKCTFKAQDSDDDPVEELVLKLKYNDVTLDYVYPTLQLYAGDIPREEITWTSSRENVATVEDGLVTPLALGGTKITATYKDQTATCMIYVSQAALDRLGIGQEPEEPENPEDPENPENPEQPENPDNPAQPQTYSLLVNGSAPKWQIDGKENTADFGLILGGSATQASSVVTVVDGDRNPVNVTWNISDTSVVIYDEESGKFVAQAAGTATLTATVDGVDFKVIIRVS